MVWRLFSFFVLEPPNKINLKHVLCLQFNVRKVKLLFFLNSNSFSAPVLTVIYIHIHKYCLMQPSDQGFVSKPLFSIIPIHIRTLQGTGQSGKTSLTCMHTLITLVLFLSLRLPHALLLLYTQNNVISVNYLCIQTCCFLSVTHS